MTSKELIFEVEEAVNEYSFKVLERTNILIGNAPVGEEITKAYMEGYKKALHDVYKCIEDELLTGGGGVADRVNGIWDSQTVVRHCWEELEKED